MDRLLRANGGGGSRGYLGPNRRHLDIRCGLATCAGGGGANGGRRPESSWWECQGQRSGARPDSGGFVGSLREEKCFPAWPLGPSAGLTGGFLLSDSSALSSWPPPPPVARHMTGGGHISAPTAGINSPV